MQKWRLYIVVSLAIVLLVAGSVWLVRQLNTSEAPTTQETSNTPASDETTPDISVPNEEPFDKEQYSITDTSSIWVVVNKDRPVPATYKPELIVPDVRLRLEPTAEQMQIDARLRNPLLKMFDTAADDGVQLVFGSGYRSYELQKQFYDSYVARDGQEAADRYSARPGTSEHQTGLSFDVTATDGTCHLEVCFEDTPEGQWVSQNAHLFGFVIRYPEGKEDITGYQYEPWHLRYVGPALAEQLHTTNQTLEEFFNLN